MALPRALLVGEHLVSLRMDLPEVDWNTAEGRPKEGLNLTVYDDLAPAPKVADLALNVSLPPLQDFPLEEAVDLGWDGVPTAGQRLWVSVRFKVKEVEDPGLSVLLLFPEGFVHDLQRTSELRIGGERPKVPLDPGSKELLLVGPWPAGKGPPGGRFLLKFPVLPPRKLGDWNIWLVCICDPKLDAATCAGEERRCEGARLVFPLPGFAIGGVAKTLPQKVAKAAAARRYGLAGKESWRPFVLHPWPVGALLAAGSTLLRSPSRTW